MILEVNDATEKVRSALHEARGQWSSVLTKILRRNPKSPITYRWLVAFAARQDREPKFTKIVELGDALGVSIRLNINHREVTHGLSRAPRKRNGSANVARRCG